MQKSQIQQLLACEQVQKLQERFSKEIVNFRIVGGAIRNIILARTVKDIDFATSYTPFELINLCKEKNIKYVPTGLQYGTITIIINKFSYEITSLREDIETNGRHAIVTYGHSWEKDSLRRDFTINALYLDFAGNIYDFHNGLEDLKDKKIKFIGNAQQRIEEDFLRILRLFRFFAELDGFSFSSDVLKICNELRKNIANLSPQRIKNEFFRILQGNNYYQSLKLLSEYKICNNFIKIHSENIELLAKYDQNNKKPPSPIVILAYFVITAVKPKKSLYQIRYRLCLSRTEIRQVKLLMGHKLDGLPSIDKEIQKLLVIYGRENLQLLYEYKILIEAKNYNNYQNILLKIQNLTIPEFPIIGEDLKALGIEEGEELGAMLASLKEKWLDSLFSLSKEDLLR